MHFQMHAETEQSKKYDLLIFFTSKSVLNIQYCSFNYHVWQNLDSEKSCQENVLFIRNVGLKESLTNIMDYQKSSPDFP